MPLLLLLVALAGCWVGKPFYAAAESRPFIAAGSYRLLDPGKKRPNDGLIRVSARADGMMRLDGAAKDEPLLVGTVPLGPGRALFWTRDDEDGEEIIYGIVEPDPRGYRLYIPNCREDRAVALAAGAVAKPNQIVPACRFATRAALEAAARKLVVQDEKAARLLRVR